MRKWNRRRIVRWLAIAAGFWVLLFVVWPLGVGWNRKTTLLSAMRSASSVIVEEFSDVDGRVLGGLELDAARRAELLRILPRAMPRGFGYTFKLCFVPHHRIVARTPGKPDFVMTICFFCDQATNDGFWIYDMRPSGSKALSDFLRANGIRVQTLEEYGNDYSQ
ncbi:hypothetical protein [Singulisphaera sp. PoT]|uniref:hypothetical protein n=1 Tax=Singulisphaera sp. PoT TaxID=3411797 RepID=UPI003BF4C5C9